MYDVIVVGAGPAGCTAAKILAERGRRVLLVERFELPRYKSCSGILIKKSLDLVEQYFGESVPNSVTCAPSDDRGMIFTDDTGKEYRFEQPGLNVWRSGFDGWLCGKAKECGAEIRDNTAAVSFKVQSDFIEVSLRGEREYTEKAAYVLDCEGAPGALKRRGGGFGRDYIITYQTFNSGKIDLDYHYFYAYLQPEFSEYDAWFNVKDNQLVLGVSVKDGADIKAYYRKFIEYMGRDHGLKIDSQIREEKWIMPHIRPGCEVNLGLGRSLFAGEIAGFLNPMGEGISAAMESGFCAAAAIDEYFGDSEKILENYRNSTANLKDYMRRQWSFVGRITGTFSHML